jgi:hypothetical protein
MAGPQPIGMEGGQRRRSGIGSYSPEQCYSTGRHLNNQTSRRNNLQYFATIQRPDPLTNLPTHRTDNHTLFKRYFYMPALSSFVAVDWRSGPDQIYFFFKETNAYSRFSIADNRVPSDYPRPVLSNWNVFNNAQDLQFGFTTTGINPAQPVGIDSDILWLFYKENGVPMVCNYNQDTDKVHSLDRLQDSPWRSLSPYFDRIVAGTWWQNYRDVQLFRFLLNDANALSLDLRTNKLTLEAITHTTWPGLENYKHRIITAVQNDRTWADSYYYIFLTDNEYIRYNIPKNKAESGPIKVDDVSWPGLLRD